MKKKPYITKDLCIEVFIKEHKRKNKEKQEIGQGDIYGTKSNHSQRRRANYYM